MVNDADPERFASASPILRRGRTRCSFCGATREDVSVLIAAEISHICNFCVASCNDKLAEEIDNTLSSRLRSWPKPREIRTFLDHYVISQEQAKKTLAVAVSNHFKRIQSMSHRRDGALQKSNILLIGPTGSGKTLLAETLARFLNVPFVIVDATKLTQAGYVGEDVEQIIGALLRKANYDVAKCERGIVYLDEIDKLVCRNDFDATRDVAGEGVQQALLKILEGTSARIPLRARGDFKQPEILQVDTSHILFIVGGAFVGLEDRIRARMQDHGIGFLPSLREIDNKNSPLKNVTSEDLVKEGLIPEFVGRLPVVVTLDELGEDDLIRVIRETRNSLLQQYETLFAINGVQLVFTEGALRAIARQACRLKTGARGLRSVFESILLETMYDLPSRDDIHQVLIGEDVVVNGATPRLLLRSDDIP